MAVVEVRNFGGLAPSISPRALGGAAAQKNQNLFLGLQEFRPLAADSTVGTGLNNAKTLYRIDASTAWITSADELSYARGQINDDASKRTYYSNNTTGAALRTFDKDGNDRQLGVPAPTTLSVATTQGVFFTSSSLIESARAAIEASMTVTEPGIRFSGTTILAGPLSNPGLFFANDTVNLPSQVRSLQEYANLYAKVAMSRVNALQLRLADVGVAYFDANFAYIPITSLPFCYVENATPMATSLAAIKNPRTNEQILTTAQINAFRNDVYTAFNTTENAYHLRTELTSYVNEFYKLLTGYPASQPTNPDPSGPTDPLGPGPTMPTVPEYYIELGVEVMDPLWEIYYAQLQEYANNKELYNVEVKDAELSNQSATDRIRDLQNKALAATKAVENIQLDLWNRIALSQDWTAERVNKALAEDILTGVDADRVIQTRFYLVTFVTDRGEESAPSPPSALQNVDQYSTTVVTCPTAPTGRFITKWRIYRSTTTTDLTLFQYVTELPIATTTFTDTISNEALGETIPTVNWLEPTAGLKGLIAMPNGIMVAFKDNTLHFCEPYAPYAFPPDYQTTTEYPIVGLGVFGQTLFVGTTGNPYFVSGSDSASMSSQKLDSNQACVSRRSIAPVPGGVIYASPDGLCFASAQGVIVVTQGLFTREDWQALVPTSIIAATHEDIYYFLYDTGSVKGCYAFDLATRKLGVVTGFTDATALYVDRQSDEFFVNAGASIKKLFATSRRTAVWRSPLITMPKQTPMAWLKVYGNQDVVTPATIRWYADGVLRHTITITDLVPVRLPPGRYLEHEVEVESAAKITKVMIVSATEELQQI